ncbi:MAG TPA: hypothetical protein VFL85_03680 [Candidatus Saccharimonadales bacterium]|nr:hypothetical protein [Candidatus Saccharimonadales bacterium]
MKTKILHHSHSGRLRGHENTSYPALMLLLLVVGFALTICTVSAASPGPQAGSIGLTGEMPGKPPTTAATIDHPAAGQHFSTSPVTISGTCPPKTLVEVYKNDIFAGSTACSDSGTYSLDIDLLIGKNKLIARVYDALNQPGPDSNAIIVYYDALPPQAESLTPLNLVGSQLLLNTDAVFRGSFPGQDMHIPVDIIGGTPPYAVNFQWGDTTNKIVSRSNNITFTTSHTYQKAGIYQITLQGTDAHGRVAFLTVAAIINGQPDVALTSGNTKPPMNKLLMLWPLYTCAIAMVISFWLGERREKHILIHQAVIYHPQT